MTSGVVRVLSLKGLWAAVIAAMISISGCGGGGGGDTTPSGPSYSIDVSASPVAGGTVGGGGNHAAGASVTVTATANTGYTFINWSEGGTEVSTTASYTFSADTDRTLVASFSLNNYTVSTSTVTGGSISPASVNVDHGGTTSFTVIPDPGYSLSGVTGCGGALVNNTYTIDAVQSDCQVVPAFVAENATLQSFTKTSDSTLSWSTSFAASCDVTNDQNSDVISVTAGSLAAGGVLHTLPAATTFTLTCTGGTGNTVSQSVSTVATNLYPQTVGYYGSASSVDNSWVAIVNLTTPITFIDRLDFNTQVDSYCTGLGYIGAAKTKTGDYSVHATHYLQASDGIIAGSGPSAKVTIIPGGATFSNVYTNRRNSNTSNGDVGVATIGNNNSTITYPVTSPTSGANQMVLCQTDISFGNTTPLPQTINFAVQGPIRTVQGIDTGYTNTASGGLGTGAITYASSNPSVATVDATTGAVTLLALGTTTITATKAADTIFQQAQASYVLNFEAPLPIGLQSFTKSSDSTLAWTTTGAASCNISNDQNAEVYTVAAGDLATGSLLHPLPAGTTFTLNCQGEDGSTANQAVTTVVTNLYPQTVGYYGSASSVDNSWVAIVNLTTPITFADSYDFNAKVDSYCQGLGYVGVLKSKTGAIALHDMYYFHTSPGIVDTIIPSQKVTLIPGDLTFTNVYTNWTNHASFQAVNRVTIGNNASSRTQLNTPSPTSGLEQMVLCQTDISFRNTTPLPQVISFVEPGPIRKVQGLDTGYTNTASGGVGTGAITYVSSNPSVATVDANTGAVTLLAQGTTTITATKAADTTFQQGQASYVLNFEAPLPIGLQSFTKTSDSTLAWTTTGAASCDISNDQNAEVYTVAAGDLASGRILHNLPAATTFTLSCQGEDGSTANQQVTAVVTNLYPQTVGYYGSASSPDNSWVAIVNLTTPITFADSYDFTAKVDSYCQGLGYSIGTVKTKTGAISLHDTYYLHTGQGIIDVYAPSKKVTLIPGDLTFTNVYTNWSNSASFQAVNRVTIGNNASSRTQLNTPSPTSGLEQMVLCQTDISFWHTTLLAQAIGFAEPGPIRKVQGLDSSFTNSASGGMGTGAITYVSSNPSVATVNVSTGAVTLLALGTTTITATKVADTIFQQAQASYVLNFEAPLPIGMQSFTKTSDSTLSWTTTGAVSCDITNNQNAEVLSVTSRTLGAGNVLHTLPAGTTFTLTCTGENGSMASRQVTTVVTNSYPQTVGYYGSASSPDNSWVAIVNLTTPISYVDGIDFNTQVDSYCTGLGYIGAAKTKTGDFSTNSTSYLQTAWAVITGNGPSKKVTLIPGGATFTNVYANETNYNTWSHVDRVTIGNNDAVRTQSRPPSPTSGVNQMVLCQTDILLGNTTLMPQTISFANPGPIRKVQGLDLTSFANTASGGVGTGAITYASSNPGVATVDATTGAVTLLALGSTTITATKAADTMFQQAQASYVLNYEAPLPIGMQSFTKTSDNTLAWTTTGAVSCEITSDQNAVVTPVAPEKLASGRLLHGLPPVTTFTLSCLGETGTTGSLSVTNVDVNLYPNTKGYYGSASTLDNSWAVMVDLINPINFVDRVDFNAQVDSYCTAKGYIGAVKTQAGDFSVHNTYYLQPSDGIIAGNGPSVKVTLIPGDATYTNVYANRRNVNSSLGDVGRATIGNNASSIVSPVTSPTTGIAPMVLCQTDISFRDTALLAQTIAFAAIGPINKTFGVDLAFNNVASGGLGSGVITYTSSNPSVATVDGSGTVTLVGVGTTTITATKAGDALFMEAQASYVLNVN